MKRENDLDNFNPNNNQNNDRERNDFFLKNRGGHPYTGRYANQNNNNYQNRRNYGYGDRPRFERGPPHFSNNGYNYNYNNNNNYGRSGYGGQRGRRNYGGNFYQRRNEDNYYNDNRGYNTDRRYGDNSNFDRQYNRENNDFENEEEREAKLEKERILSDFKKKYGKIIEAFKNLFFDESLKEEKIIDIIKMIKSNPNLTIFEAMNLIYREVQIIKTLNLDKSKRQYGPHSDKIEFKFEKYLNRDDLKEVLKKYKIYKNEEEIPEKERDEEEIHINFDSNRGDKKSEVYNKEKNMNKSWFYVDDFDKRRKLAKDEEGCFNYLPLMNPEGNKNNNDEEDIYAKNENEISYHSLFYKTLICKECPNLNINAINTLPQLLCPYAHNILKDFRIIYDYTNENVCKFMILLQDSNLFNFQNYLNYIPMSLSPKFNIDSFKVHKCQLDEGNCPNDYHLCPYYHKGAKVDDQRRPPLLFGYSGSQGEKCFNKKGKEYCPEKCPSGIFCNYVHNKNEFNYHQSHFRKEFDCKRKKDKNGKCIFIKTCYGKHDEDEYKENNEDSEKEEEVEEEEIENDDEIKKIKKKVKNIFSIAKTFRCRQCQNIESDICYLTKCKHFFCLKCYKKIFKEKKKEGKNLECPFCAKEITKDNIVKVEF